MNTSLWNRLPSNTGMGVDISIAMCHGEGVCYPTHFSSSSAHVRSRHIQPAALLYSPQWRYHYTVDTYNISPQWRYHYTVDTYNISPQWRYHYTVDTYNISPQWRYHYTVDTYNISPQWRYHYTVILSDQP